MKPEFPRTSIAISSILSFYEINHIEDYLDYWSGKHTWLVDYVPNWAEFTRKTIERMDSEISQNIYTTNHNTQVDMFENLRGWINDYRISEVNKNVILLALNAENEKRLEKHAEEVESKIEEKPDLISEEYLHKYYGMVEVLITKFKDTIRPYLERYDSGKINGNSQVSIQILPENTSQPPKALPETTQLLKSKIKWKGSAQEFAKTFAPLINEKKLYLQRNNRNETDPIVIRLHEFFEIQKENETGEIALGTLKTNFKNFNAEQKERNTKNK